MIRRISKFLPLILLTTLFTPVVAPALLESSEARSGKTTICHRTNSIQNPYRRITVSNSSLNSGHKKHTGGLWTTSSTQGGTKWGDIIPDATAGGDNTTDLNFTGDAAGQAIWRGQTINPRNGSPVCKTMTMKSYYDSEKAAGQTDAEIVAELKDAEADDDLLLLQTLSLTFSTLTTTNLTTVVTASVAISVSTLAPSSVGVSTATLNGSVKTDSTALTCHFEYGTNSGFDPSTLNPSTATSVTLNTTSSRTVSLTGLASTTKYYYRLVCHDSGGGDLYGETVSFTTGTTYTITYDSNTALSGSVPTDYTLYASSESASIRGNENSLVRTGYTFAGWTELANGSGTVYSPGNTTTIAMSQNRVLYAKWTATTFPVIFDSNTATSGTISNQTFTAGTSQALTSNSFAKTGYTFNGWNTVANGSGTSFTNQQSVTLYETTTAYAQWTAGTYSVTFDSNTASSGAMSNQSFTAGTSFPLTTNGFTKTGYTFAGWATSSGGSVVYSNTASVSLYAATTLYAKWTAGTYSVTFDSNTASSGAMSNQSFTAGTGQALTTNGFTKAGFTFNGWATTSGGVVVYSNTASITIYADLTLYANWTSNSDWRIDYDGNSNTGGTIPAFQTVTRTLAIATQANSGSLVRTGYLFNGWNTNSGGTGTPYAVSANITPTANTTLYAKWVATSFLISFDSNTATSGSMSNQTFTAGTGQALTGIGFAKTGFSFGGWATSSGGSVVYTDSQTVTLYETATVYAKWTAGSFTLTFDSNTATSGATSSQSFTAGTAQAITSNGFSKTSFSFAGWSSTSGGSVEYTNGASLTIYADTTLYAIWTPTYSVTYTLDGGSGTAPTESNKAGGATFNLASGSGLTKSGYTFAGWSCNSGSTQSAGSSFTMPSTSLTCIAQWTAASSGNGGNSGGGNSISAAASSKPTPASVRKSATLVTLATTPVKSTMIVTPAVIVTPGTSGTTPASGGTTPTTGSTPPGNSGSTPATGGSTPALPGASGSTRAPINATNTALSQTTVIPVTGTQLNTFSGSGVSKVAVVGQEVSIQAKTGFSGKTTVKITTTKDEEVSVITAQVTVLPLPVTNPVVKVVSGEQTRIQWVRSPNAVTYEVIQGGKLLCTTAASMCTVRQVLAASPAVEVKSLGRDQTESNFIQAKFVAPIASPVIPEIALVVNFDTAKYNLDAGDKAFIRAFAADVVKYGYTKVDITGHTDSRAGIDNNVLSNNRAKAARDYLVSLLPTLKVTVNGYADAINVATNTTAEGMAANRRAEFRVVS